MTDIDPNHVQHAVENSTGLWTSVTAGLMSVLGLVGGAILKDQNDRLKSIEKSHTEITGSMATRDDIEAIYGKMNANHEKTVDRIIEIIREGK